MIAARLVVDWWAVKVSVGSGAGVIIAGNVIDRIRNRHRYRSPSRSTTRRIDRLAEKETNE